MRAAVKNKRSLLALLKANGEKIRSFGVNNLSIFGSFITGKLNADSDVDLLVEFDPQQKSYDNFIELSFFLEDLLGRRVEIVTPQSLSKHIGPHILSQAKNVTF